VTWTSCGTEDRALEEDKDVQRMKCAMETEEWGDKVTTKQNIRQILSAPDLLLLTPHSRNATIEHVHLSSWVP
jgi:hypothetical protein